MTKGENPPEPVESQDPEAPESSDPEPAPEPEPEPTPEGNESAVAGREADPNGEDSGANSA